MLDEKHCSAEIYLKEKEFRLLMQKVEDMKKKVNYYCSEMQKLENKINDLKTENKILEKDYADIRKIMNEECDKNKCPYAIEEKIK